MNIKLAGQKFLTTPSLGRTLVISGGAGAGAAALAHLLNAPKEQQIAIAEEAEGRGLTATELIIGALAATLVGDGTHRSGLLDEEADDGAKEVRVKKLIDDERYRAQARPRIY